MKGYFLHLLLLVSRTSSFVWSGKGSFSSSRRRWQGLTEEAARNEISLRNEVVPEDEEVSERTGKKPIDTGNGIAVNVTTSSMLNAPALLFEKTLQAGEGLFAGSDSAPTRRGRDIVVLGSGWGAASFVKALGDNALFDSVTVVSPRNYFLFTPMLAGAAVGTVEYRSITEPLRKLNANVDYLEATAMRVDFERRIVECEAVICEGTSCKIEDFEVPYDALVCGVGATTNTFGVPGVREHCLFLKEVGDAEALRKAVGNVLERANLPGTSDEEIRRALSFVVVGAGPTGVEFCSELRDFLQSEATKYYPNLVKFASITLLEATGTVLSAFDETLRDVALEELKRERVTKKNGAVSIVAPIDVRLGTAVSSINDTDVRLGQNGESIPYGVCVWAGGIGPLRVVSQAIESLGEIQQNSQKVTRGRFAVDSHLRVLGTKRGEVYALGDCAAYAETPLPATAQVAAQQGEYLAKLLASDYDTSQPIPCRPLKKNLLPSEKLFCRVEGDDVYARGFQFLDLGILTYVGDSKALAQVSFGPAKVKGGGRVAFGLWRSVYLAKQMSLRNRLLIFGDWVRGRFFGRDITRF